MVVKAFTGLILGALAVPPAMAQDENRHSLPGARAVTDVSQDTGPDTTVPDKVAPAQNPLRPRQVGAEDGEASK